MIEKSGTRTVVSEMEDKSQIKFLRSGFRDFARIDNESINRAFNSSIIRELQKNADINVGDKVVSSGFSTIYPENLPVGEVTEIFDERGSFQKVARIKIESDISSILSAFVIVGELDDKK